MITARENARHEARSAAGETLRFVAFYASAEATTRHERELRAEVAVGDGRWDES